MNEMEMLVESQLIDESDPSLLSKSEIIESWGSLCNFMLSYGLKPYNFEDIDEAISISRALKEQDNYDEEDDDDEDDENDDDDEDDEDENDDGDEEDENNNNNNNNNNNSNNLGLMQGNQDDVAIPVGLKINIANTGEEDKLVDAYQPGTIVTVDIGRENNPIGRICKFNYGVGIFSNPAYNPTKEEIQRQFRMDAERSHFSDPDDDDFCYGQCSYTIRYSNGEFVNVVCSEIHTDWDVISPLSNNVEQTDLNDNLTISIPLNSRTLIITGLLFDSLDCCHYTSGLKEIYSSNNTDLDIILYNFNEMKNKIVSGEYSAVILLMFGAAGPNSDTKEIINNDMSSVITSFVKSGGTFIVQGEGIVTTLLSKCFQKKWYIASYERENYERHLLPTLSPELIESFPSTYNAKTVTLSNVEDNCKLYSDDDDQCCIAVSNYESGKFVFIGDVNSENETIKIMYTLANN